MYKTGLNVSELTKAIVAELVVFEVLNSVKEKENN
jgi:hypothetical protein